MKKLIAMFLPLLFLAFMLLTGCSIEERGWTAYKADAASSSYSPLEEINTKNVHALKPAWTFDPGDAMPGAWQAGSQCNPIIIDGVMYLASMRHRIYAVNAENGKMIWSFDPFNGGPGGGSFRGVTYWADGKDKRILFTGGDLLFALDAVTGKPIHEFGDDGKVSMNIGMRDDPEKISVKPTTPGIVYKDLLIIGNEVSELYGAQPGYVRAYNIRTGKLEWTFHTVPKPGELGYETWPKDAWKYAGGANCWGGLSVDEKRGMVFFGTGSPSYDFYGADRAGENLFGNCVVALDAATGKHIWHFQTIHHDLWDYDLPAPPNLVTVVRDGKEIDAVAQTSKIGFLYVLDRETGTSLFPIEERPVPASDVPGEQTWPTQPFPLKPKAYSRQFMTEDDLSDFSPAAHDSLVKMFRATRYEGLFTPPSVKGTWNLPGTIGGSEWGGAAYDHSTHIIYLKSNEAPEIDLLQKIEPAKNTGAVSDYNDGNKIYTSYCASCHKADRTGDSPLYPSLVDIGKKMSAAEILNKIKQGGGKMPPLGSVIAGHEEGIVDYLLDRKEKEFSQAAQDLKEIGTNRLSNTVAGKDKAADTATTYLNIKAYAILKDSEGHPAIKPPWGTLNAINLNTGEYAWTIPVGTGSPGPIVTAGGLVFLGGARDHKFQAYDKVTGKLLWEIILPANTTATPCTYRSGGKQYVAVSVGKHEENPAGSVMAFALPE